MIDTDSADAAREVLIGVAAAMITVTGVVFSITILALTLASQQFGPRMLRNFIRDRGTQVTLGAFVATFVYSILTLGAVSATFVPELSIAVALALTLACIGVLIYFIHHVAGEIPAHLRRSVDRRRFRGHRSRGARGIGCARPAGSRSQPLGARAPPPLCPRRSDGVFRDRMGNVRLIEPVITYERLVKGAFDKVRQAARGMPAVLIRSFKAWR